MDVRSLLVDIVRNDVDPVDAATPLKMIRGLDSLAMVNLVLKIESALDRQLTEHELERLVTVGDVEQLLRPR
ncbi:MAG: acyl carrier protein [Actinobacteria bacterium]|nr:MAG: acyl carrier protein [Actinomycetota bacterium]